MSRAATRERRSPVPRHVRKRESIRRLKLAMAEDRLTLLYQPIFSAAGRRAVTAEALLRWRHPDREEDDLGLLLAAAERSPVIFALETWAMRECFRDAAAWQAGPLPELRVNLNLSAREFQRGELPRRVRRELDRAGMDPARLTLEITETSAIHGPDDVARIVERLQEDGVQLWLDDFGTGHSSLEWLSWFQAAGLKIPGTFVARLGSDERTAVITAATIEMAHALGLQVAAEGIETQEQLDHVIAAGCDDLQGFLLGQASPAADLPARLANG